MASAFFALAGAVALVACLVHAINTHRFQADKSRELEHLRASRQLDAASFGLDGPVEHGAVLGRIEIPRVGVSSVIVEGIARPELEYAVGHLPGTPFPGAGGNSALAGHRDSFFRGLREIVPGDTVRIEMPYDEIRYRVVTTEIVERDAVHVLGPSDDETLTLITCHPFNWVGPAPRRFVVRAIALDGTAS